ncbi:MAG: glycosylhydrolase-like jelly roll fold domain-containing protein, partial [Pirellulaceae bacterium]
VIAWQAGKYELQTAHGNSLEFTVDSLPQPLPINGPWQVRFAEGWGAPNTATFSKLQDWTQHSEPAIRYYSGKATYRTSFTLPEPWTGRSLWLDLGEVRDLATVRVNGQELDTLWMEPWRVEITAVALPGDNQLEIDIINPWNNRLVGDAKRPPDERTTFLAKNTVPKNTPLLSAGLLGPVTLHAAERVTLK